MKKKIQLTLLILLVSLSSILSQVNYRDGFIITLDKDTIKGQVDYRSNSKNYISCIFKSNSDEKEYFPNQISGFGYTDGRFFSSKIIVESFVEVLVLGKINLYRSKGKYHIKKDTTFIDLESRIKRVKVHGKVTYQEQSKWKGMLSYLISDCLKNPANLVSNIKLDERGLVKLLVKYNKCSNKHFLAYKIKKPWVKIAYGATIGITQSNILVTAKQRSFARFGNSFTSIDPSLGLIAELIFPRLTEKASIQAELSISKPSYSSLVKIEKYPPQIHDIFIDLTTLSIPLSLKYSFLKDKYNFYLQAGTNFDVHVDSKTKILTEEIVDNVVTTYPEKPAFVINKFQIGYWGGIGILRSFQKFNGEISVRYFRMTGLNKLHGFTANNHRISLNFIISKK